MSFLWSSLHRALIPRRALLPIMVLYAILNIAYSIAFPIFESWDELHHYDYVRSLIEQRNLPVIAEGEGETEFHQPPAYYLITALLTPYLPTDDYRPEENNAFAQPYWYQHNKNRYIHLRSVEGWPWHGIALNVHVMRLLGLLWGGAAIILTYHLAQRLRPAESGGEWMPVAAAVVVGFNPTFLYITSSINNEALAVAIGAALSLALVHVAAEGLTPRRAALLGILTGLAALTKWTLVPFAAVALATVLISEAMRREPLRQGLLLISAIAIAAAVSGWWYIRNAMLYGDFTAVSVMCREWNACASSTGPVFAPGTLWEAYVGYWGTFGPWGSIRLPNWIYAVMGLVIAGGLAGLALRWLNGALSDADKRRIFVLGSICVGFAISTLTAAHESKYGIQPRYLFGAHAAASSLLALGWWHVLRRWAAPAGVFTFTHTTWAALPALLAIVSLFGYIVPAYGAPLIVSNPDELDYAASYDVQVGDFARLIGVSVPEHGEPGSLIWVRTCWEALQKPEQSYWQYVHLVGANDQKLAGIDSVPGRGNYPTLDWHSGTAHCTDWPIELPADAPPGRYTVQTGLYERDTLARVEAPFGDGHTFNPPIIGTLVIDAQPGELPPEAQSVEAEFGGIIRLRGAEIGSVENGQVNITLYWEAITLPPQSYTVFIHLVEVGGSGSPIAQSDGIPRSGLYPTDLWLPGGLVDDVHTLELPRELPPGFYELRVGLYDLATGQRLPGPNSDLSASIP